MGGAAPGKVAGAPRPEVVARACPHPSRSLTAARKPGRLQPIRGAGIGRALGRAHGHRAQLWSCGNGPGRQRVGVDTRRGAGEAQARETSRGVVSSDGRCTRLVGRGASQARAECGPRAAIARAADAAAEMALQAPKAPRGGQRRRAAGSQTIWDHDRSQASCKAPAACCWPRQVRPGPGQGT